MKKAALLRSYYVLPCSLLLLNLVNNLLSYKVAVIADPLLRVALIMALVLFGGTFVAFALSPAVEALLRRIHRGSRNAAGILGEIVFLALLGLGVFWLYYTYYIHGAEALLPREWWNHPPANA
jgi:hypothetical protein